MPGSSQTTRSARARRAQRSAPAIMLGLAACLACAHSPTDEAAPPATGPAWLAGDHHVHSHFSVGWNTDRDPPTYQLGGDAHYTIAMNALMARRFGLAWMVSTDHGGPGHGKVNLEHAYPELLVSRESVPEVVQFYGMELNSPGADHSTWIMPRSDDEARTLYEIESRFDAREAWPADPARDDEARMLEALRVAAALEPPPVVIANHPARSAESVGAWGKDDPAELRRWNDTAPDVAVGMEGAPGHQAAGVSVRSGVKARMEGFEEKAKKYGLPPGPMPRGFYFRSPTRGGFDPMTAIVGGFWDSMLAEGRRWWITANSDSHVHHTDGGIDFWPGEYSKTWVRAERSHDSILEGLRAGRIFVATGDLVTAVELRVRAGDESAGIGDELVVAEGTELELEISFVDPASPNARGERPAVHRVDLIRGPIHGPAADASTDHEPGTKVIERFERDGWSEDEPTTLRLALGPATESFYVRLRGTSTAELEPEPDVPGEDPWADLWFYTNPVFVRVIE